MRPDDFEDLPIEPTRIHCPYCGITAVTRVKKSKVDMCCACLIGILKLILAFTLAAFMVLLIIACVIVTKIGDSDNDDGGMEWFQWYFLMWVAPS